MYLYSEEFQTSADRCGNPLRPFLDSYAAEMRAEGYAQETAKLYVRWIANFSDWLAERRVKARDITAKLADQYLQMRARRQRPSRSGHAALKRMVNLLIRQKVIMAPAALTITTPTQQILNRFDLYLRDERALAPATRLYYAEFAGKFMASQFGGRPVDISRIKHNDISNCA